MKRTITLEIKVTVPHQVHNGQVEDGINAALKPLCHSGDWTLDEVKITGIGKPTHK